MGIHREHGYSAQVEGFLVLADDTRVRLAKTNGCTLVLAEGCTLPPGTTAELLIIVDGQRDSKHVTLPTGVREGQTLVPYEVVAPF